MAELESRLEDLMREGRELVDEGTALLDLPPLAPDLDPVARCCGARCPTTARTSSRATASCSIIEDDATFARTVLDTARERGFKGIVALRGDSGLALAHEFQPDAIVLDMELPVMDGWTVLDHLKHHPATRHIPVHIVSAGDDGRTNALRAGAVAYLEKPLAKEGARHDARRDRVVHRPRRPRSLLVVEDDDDQRNSIVELVGSGDDVDVTAVGSSGGGARRQLARAGTSTAWCSTSSCRRRPASSCSSS